MMPDLFEIATGSVIGRSHRIAGKNNQDASCVLQTADCTIAIICDGCGSGAQSEVGAKLGARLIAVSLLRRAQELSESDNDAESTIQSLLEMVRCEVLDQLSTLAAGMGECLPRIVNDYFLFTVVGALITPASAVFFSLGDGVLVINDEVTALGPFPGNAPPYLAYGLVESSLKASEPEQLRFRVQRTMPTAELQSFLLGTDGVQDLMHVAPRNLPGKAQLVGPLRQFWQEDRYFANPDMIRRKLAGVNRDVTALRTNHAESHPGCVLHKEAGLLHDDTTLIVGRRQKGGSVS
jgi:hypothetical protein